MSETISNTYKTLIASKRYWIIYLAFIFVASLTTLTSKNISSPVFEIAVFAIVAVLGVVCIVFYFMHDNKSELYKTAFVVIICFRLLSAMIVPICDVSDEMEHLTRSEITSRGVLYPEWHGGDKNSTSLYTHTDSGVVLNENVGFETSKSHIFFFENLGKTVFETSEDTQKISDEIMLDGSAFEQNPFYGYLPQAFGIFIAKMLDLNVIWMLWLARIFNLICYAGLVSLAVRKTPVLKLPLLCVACIPISIYQAASASIDSMIIGLAILNISYFLHMYFSGEGSLDTKEIVIFSLLSLLLGLCKLPYLAFVFLMLLVPKENFKNRKYVLLAILAVGCVGLLWSHIAEPALMHSWRSRRAIDAGAQMSYLMGHPIKILTFLRLTFTYDIGVVLNGLFNFFGGGQANHYTDHYTVITVLIWIYLLVMLIFYPKKENFTLKTRLGSLLVVLMIYVGTCVIQLLTWSNVGEMSLGISARYFVVLFAFLPVISSLRLERENIDSYAIVFMVGFMALMIISFATKYY